jgi:tripartite-type tricarboxylate transporter receptor subunit TctC
MKKFLTTGAAVAAVFAAMGGIAQAQYAQNEEVKVLIGYAPGGGSDALANLVHPFLTKELGINLVNEYRPGASGAIAWTMLAKQTNADGNTISITTTPTLVTNPMMNPDIRYELEEFDLIANIVTDPGVIVVARDSQFQTAEEFFDHARENPGRVTVGNSGVGGDDYFATLMVEEQSDLDFQLIPFEGDGPSWTAAMGGQIDASFNNLGITYPQIQAGNLRVLAIMAAERHEGLPDVPTMRELGYDVISGSSRGYAAPAGLPQERREALVSAMEKVTQDPEFLAVARERAIEIDFMGGEDYKNYLVGMKDTYGRLMERGEAQ